MEERLQQILTELQALRQEFQTFREAVCSSRTIIESMLRRRGVYAVKYTPRECVTLPPNCSKDSEDTLYRLMKKYSFRIFLRDLITYLTHLKFEYLTRYCSEEVARNYLTTLVQHHILCQKTSGEYQFTGGHTPTFGDTLEWFIANVMEREFASPATWGNRLKDNEVGGDYDVIANVEGHFAYIEVKSSPPKHIDIPEVKAFLDRVQCLRPDLAIFLEDTHLRMKDKLAVMFTEEMHHRYGERAKQAYPVRRLHEEIFTIKTKIFISNTKPDLITNIGICLKHFLARDL